MTTQEATTGMRVAFIGLGVMGAAMAANLARKGFAPVVFNRTPAKAAPLVALGAKQAETALEAARNADVVFLCLSATEDVAAVLFGSAGIAPALTRGTTVIDTSTIDPIAAREFAERLAVQGVDLLDSPVTGGEKGAINGTLTCMVGGSADALARGRPCLEAIASRIIHMGEAGAGQVTKACNQICAATTWLGISEALALAVKLGVDPGRVREVLLGGTARSAGLEGNGARFLASDFKPGFRAALMEKDIRIAVETLSRARVFAPVVGNVLQVLKTLVETGHADDDWISVARLVQELSGVPKETPPK
ncbi:NAD(P)-dependent oxidoreductase [Xanthobacteraceae bacterium Astr-EGSB]|uniref:NAD(P)-dependent oxidoreductase n=1 Tax=Astrobacterium formosum TaxID=3069710 RepID=UPI0027B72408|nr:NAD(P)-dependent oxidoreductase [Xanthobacteraceae bacterium Astr-EGSB]